MDAQHPGRVGAPGLMAVAAPARLGSAADRNPAGAVVVPHRSGTGPAATALPEVSIVLVVRDGAAWLAQCLDAIARQTFRPRRLLVVDLASTDTSVAIATAHQPVRHRIPDVDILELPAQTPIGRAVDRGIRSLPRDDARQLVWILRDDSAPAPDALTLLVEELRRSSSDGVVGPKLVDWDDERRLVELGIQITRTGRPLAAPTRGEPDQGQHDSRTDVLAVNLCGMLLDRAVHTELGGFDETFERWGAALDFGWRAQLAGHRVVVVPAAVVRVVGPGGQPGRPSAREIERHDRRAARRVALARTAPFAAPFLALWMAVSSVLAAAVLLVAKRPRQAWRELADLGALADPAGIAAARARGRASMRLRQRDLATLFVTPGVAARTTVDHIQDAITPERTQRRWEGRAAPETGPVDEESESLDALPASLPRRIATHPGFLAVLMVLVASLLAWRDPIRAGALAAAHTGVAGGELLPVTTGSAGLWHAFRDAWHGSGLGSGTDAGPALAVLAGLTWLLERVPGLGDGRSAAGTTIAWLMVLAPALSAWSAYLAGRVVASARIPRAVVGAAWGLAAVLTTGVVEGRLGVLIAHILAPFILAGFVLAARRDGTFTASFATALAIAVAGAFVPPWLALAALAALGLLVAGPGSRRLRAVVLLVVPGALLGPWLQRFVADWRLLLSGPGLLDTSGPPGPLALVLGQPSGPLVGWQWALAPVVVLGLLGYAARARSRAESIGLWVAVLVALLGLTLALASGRVVLGSASTGAGTSAAAHLWAGVGLDLWLAGLLVGLLTGARAVLAALAPPVRRWPAVAAVTAILFVAAPVGAAAVRWAVVGIGEDLTVGRATLPAVAVEQGDGPLGSRLLQLRPSADVVDFRLVGSEPGALLRDLDVPEPDVSPLVQAVAGLVGGHQGDRAPAQALAALAVGFVQVAGDDDETIRRLDSTDGLSRLGSDEHGTLWKVRPLPSAPGAAPPVAPSRVRLVDSRGRMLAAVPTVGPHGAVDHVLPAGPDGRQVVVAEPPAWAEHVTVRLDERVVAPRRGAEQPTYRVPPGGGHLVIDLAAAQPWWRAGQAALLGFVCFMALPFGNRRSRRRA